MSGVAVTGAGGQLAQQLQAMGTERKGWHFYSRAEWDVASFEAGMRIAERERPTVIVNCAAYTAVDQAEQDAQAAFRANAEGPQSLRRIIDATGIAVLHISTDYVAGDGRCTPLEETDTVAPRGVYAQSKRAGEVALLDSPRAIVLRTGWLYSAFGKNFFLTMARRALANADSRVVSDQVGAPTWAGFLAEVIAKIVESNEWHAGLYHCSNAGVASWYDFAHAIYAALGSKGHVAPIASAEYPQLAPRPPYSVLRCQKLQRYYNIHIPHWHEALQGCLAEFEERKEQLL